MRHDGQGHAVHGAVRRRREHGTGVVFARLVADVAVVGVSRFLESVEQRVQAGPVFCAELCAL